MIVQAETWLALHDEDECLEHYGRKGMKWYQSIYGSKDKGSSSGSRPKKPQNSWQKMAAERSETRAKKKSERDAQKVEREKKRQIERRERILKNPTKLYKHRYEFTQDEINSALKQFEWEKKLNEYSVNQLERGKKYLDVAFNTVNSSINIYNAAARIANTFNPDDKPWPYVPQATVKKDKGKDKKD